MAESLARGGEAAPGGAPKKKHEDVETQNLEKFADYVEETENSEELGKVRSVLEPLLMLVCVVILARQ